MKLKYILIVLFLSFITENLAAQDYQTKFEDLCKKKDTVGQMKLLKTWKKEQSNDPELYVAYFNYYVQRSMHDVITIDKEPAASDSPKAYREGDSVNAVGYINAHTEYRIDELKMAVKYIDEGIKRFPNRLDMRFGKTYILGEANYLNQLTDETVSIVEYSSTNKNAWLWTNNKPVDNPEKYMLDAIQDYVLKLYEAGDHQADNMILIAESVAKYYPNHIQNLTNLGIAYLIKKDYGKALEYLNKAEKIAPADEVVMMNIALVYMELSNKSKAIEYYEKLKLSKDESTRKYAEEQLNKARSN